MVTVLPEIVATPVLLLEKTSGSEIPAGPFSLNEGSPKVLSTGPQETPGSVLGMPVMGTKGTPGAGVLLGVVLGALLGMPPIGVRVTASRLLGDLSKEASANPPVAPSEPPPPQAASIKLRIRGRMMWRALAALE
jgi:hypothetical protein